MNDVLSGLGNRHREDRSKLLVHIRKNLPELVGNKESKKHRYIHNSIDLLAQYGDDFDLFLLGEFLDVEGELPKFHVKESIKKLKDRLAMEKEISEVRSNRSKKPSEKKAQSTTTVPRESSVFTQTGTVEKTKRWSEWSLILAVILSLGGLILWIKSKSSKKQQGRSFKG